MNRADILKLDINVILAICYVMHMVVENAPYICSTSTKFPTTVHTMLNSVGTTSRLLSVPKINFFENIVRCRHIHHFSNYHKVRINMYSDHCSYKDKLCWDNMVTIRKLTKSTLHEHRKRKERWNRFMIF